MRSFVVFAVLAAASLAVSGLDLGFLNGLNFTDVVEKFPFRFTSCETISPIIGKTLAWNSVSVDPETSSTAKKTTANAMIGLGALPGAVNVPFAVLAYAVGSAAVDMKVLSFANILLSATPSLDATFEGGVVAMAALNMQEIDPEGNPVGKAIPLRVPLFSNPEIEETKGDDGNITALSITYSPAETTAKVTVTYVTSKKAGVLSYGNTPVSPRTYEMIIEVNDFPLTDVKNHVAMNVAMLSSKGAGSLRGNAKIVPHFGEDELYIAVSNETVVDGKRAEVSVTIDVDAASSEYFLAADAVLKAALGKDFDADIAKVEFPAGATNFIYDPVIGVGSNIYDAAVSDATSGSSSSKSTDATSSSSSAKTASSSAKPSSSGANTVALSLLAALVSILIYLF